MASRIPARILRQLSQRYLIRGPTVFAPVLAGQLGTAPSEGFAGDGV